MGIRKTDRDIDREDIAHDINGELIGTGISVSGGGDKGPCQVVVSRLNREELDRVIDAILVATGGERRRGGAAGRDQP